MTSMFSGVERAGSVSSIRSRKTPAWPRVSSQLKSAVRSPPTCRTPVGEGAKRTLITWRAMLLGAHVSTAGGLVKAHERGVESESEAIQIFNQSPRMWRPGNYKANDIAEFNERMADGPVKSVVIHAVYLINCASNEPDIRA